MSKRKPSATGPFWKLYTAADCASRNFVIWKLSELYFDEGFIKVEGKGSKQRLVPISPRAIKEIKYWLLDRNLGKIKKGFEDYVFLARWGNSISRIMVFT